jgi:DsbC/DsbD-like thiol-disulfide interchange protein
MVRRIFAPALLFLTLGPAFSQNLSHLKVELLSEQSTLQPGGSVTVGFHIRLQRDWHIYWRNPGDSGMTPEIIWTLPKGITAGDVLWPTPRRIAVPQLADYGYTNEVTLMVPLRAAPDLAPGRLVRVTAHFRWLVCHDICIPGDQYLSLRLRIRKGQPRINSRDESYFQSARRRLPADPPDGWKTSCSEDKKDFLIHVSTGEPAAKAVSALFFPLHPDQVENAPEQAFHARGNSFELAVRKSDQLSSGVQTLEGVLWVKEKKSSQGYRVSIPVR